MTVPEAVCVTRTVPLPCAGLVGDDTVEASAVATLAAAALADGVEACATEGDTAAGVGAAMLADRCARVAAGCPAADVGRDGLAEVARSTLTAGVVDTELLPPATAAGTDPEATVAGVAPAAGSEGTTDPAGFRTLPVTDEVIAEEGTGVGLEGAEEALAEEELPGGILADPRYFVSAE